MAKKNDKSSVYTSTYTESVASYHDYADSYDIALIYNTGSNMNEIISKTKNILKGKGYTVRDSTDLQMVAGELKAVRHIEETLPAKYRIIFVNKAYKKHDLPIHAPMLYNRNFTTRDNTLVVVREVHLKILPDELKDLERHILENVTVAEVVDAVTQFEMGKGNLEVSDIKKFEGQHKIFCDVVDKFDTKRSFILIVNLAHPVPACARHLAVVPWLKVFDFDCETSSNGLLSVVKPYLTPGKFSISTTDASSRASSDKSMDWTRWVCSEVESNTGETPLDSHVKSISQYCSGQKVATLIILWYTNNADLDFDLFELVHNIKTAFRGNRGIKCVLFTDKPPEDNTALARITRGTNKDESRVVVPLTVLCKWIEMEREDHGEDENRFRLLPSYKKSPEHDGTVAITDRHYNWLSTDMDVLTFSRDKPKIDDEHALPGGVDFLQGGLISWDTLGDGRFDATRDIMDVVVDHIEKEHVEKGISGAVFIHHHPGSGGTTFGRRVLWEMRKKVPCMALHPPFEDTEDFREKIKFVRNHTNITVLLLIDGKAEVEKILTALSYEKIIILHILRYYGSMENKRHSGGHFYLKDEISRKEAERILPIYGKFGTHSCEGLRLRAGMDKVYMYEYGLTAFTENFRGVRGYVRGHLKLEEREPWHTVIAFLALALHYGQKMLPCELFSNLLKIKPNGIVKKQSIPYHGRQMIKEEGDKWSITYTEVAREILKQVLTREGELSPTESRVLQLSGSACEELKDLAISFIQEMKGSRMDSEEVPRHKLLILREVFIMRPENRDEKDKYNKYSMLLRDVENNEYRGDILRKLVECFPKHADFHAHLGRYYGKSGILEKAEECFQEAIQVRLDELAQHHRGHQQESDEVLQRVHHMLGFFYYERIPSKITQGEKIGETDVANILKLANDAIKQFEESRKYFILGTNPTFAILGEVKVRLRVSKLAKELNLLRANAGDIPRFLERLKVFSCESFGICDHLLAQCIEQATESEIQDSEFNFCMRTVVIVFQDTVPLLEMWAKRSSTLSSKLCHVALLKRDLCPRGQRFSVFTDVKKVDDLNTLLSLYEAIIKGTLDTRKRISSEMLDWLKVIRLTTNPYSLDKVLEFVEMWDKRNEKNSLSTYYLYVVNVVLAISFPGENMSHLYRQKAEKLRDKLENAESGLSRHVLFRAHEWLGVAPLIPTINILIHRDMLGSNFLEYPNKRRLLRRCAGTIITIKGWYGWLNLDGFTDPVIKVFFAPQHYGLTSQHARENVRAEFYLGFNPRYGAEAFDLVCLETKTCPCGNVTEIRTVGDDKSPKECRVCSKPFQYGL